MATAGDTTTPDLERETPDDERSVAIGQASADGLLILESALRLAVKNAMIRRVMGPKGSITDHEGELVVVAELHVLSAESRRAARRLREVEHDAKQMTGRGQHARDYRAADVPALRSRITDSEWLAERTAALAEDSDYVQVQAHRCRNAALEEIVFSRLPSTQSLSIDGEAHDAAMKAIRRDLRRLRKRRRVGRRRQARQDGTPRA